jgi:predicted flavoprotein YhiN
VYDVSRLVTSSGSAQHVDLTLPEEEEAELQKEWKGHRNQQSVISTNHSSTNERNIGLVQEKESIDKTVMKRMPIRANAPNAVKAAMLAILGK